MSYEILDTDGNPLSSFSFSMEFNTLKEFDVKVYARSGVRLRSINGANVFYYARFDPGDSWTDLEAVGLDLTPFADTLKIIHVKVQNNETTTVKQQSTTLYLQ
jgi:hypothetical protein